MTLYTYEHLNFIPSLDEHEKFYNLQAKEKRNLGPGLQSVHNVKIFNGGNFVLWKLVFNKMTVKTYTLNSFLYIYADALIVFEQYLNMYYPAFLGPDLTW